MNHSIADTGQCAVASLGTFQCFLPLLPKVLNSPFFCKFHPKSIIQLAFCPASMSFITWGWAVPVLLSFPACTMASLSGPLCPSGLPCNGLCQPVSQRGQSGSSAAFLLTYLRAENGLPLCDCFAQESSNHHIAHHPSVFTTSNPNGAASLMSTFDQLHQEVTIFHTLQGPPRLFSLCCVVFPANVW